MQSNKAKILVLGSGGREHAIAWKLEQSPLVAKVFVAPGNGGTDHNVDLDLLDFPAIKSFCKKQSIELIVVGPELPLTEGIVNYFEGTEIQVFGPNMFAAQLEGSKTFAKEFMQRNKVKTAEFWSFSHIDQATECIKLLDGKLVIKYDGLAGGKGVYVCKTHRQAFEALSELEAIHGSEFPFLIERRLQGVELSIIGFTDGQHIRILSPSQDHKQLLEDDKGPNTGGMGAFCPLPFLGIEQLRKIYRDIINPTMFGLVKEQITYKGILYFGIMITEEGPRLLEYNVRLGDPETEVILPALKSDLYELIQACLNETLSQIKLDFHDGYFVDVVLVSSGYPYKYEKGFPILVSENLDHGSMIFHAGTQRDKGTISTNGGRVLNVVAHAKTLESAIQKVYSEVDKIQFENKTYRKDIGLRRNVLPIQS